MGMARDGGFVANVESIRDHKFPSKGFHSKSFKRPFRSCVLWPASPIAKQSCFTPGLSNLGPHIRPSIVLVHIGGVLIVRPHWTFFALRVWIGVLLHIGMYMSTGQNICSRLCIILLAIPWQLLLQWLHCQIFAMTQSFSCSIDGL